MNRYGECSFRRALLIAVMGLAFIAYFVGFATKARAQSLSVTTPFQTTSTISNGSVASTNAFQSIMASSATRKGCRIQNTSSNTMYLYVGAPSAATTPKSFQLLTKTFWDCAFGVTVITDQISVTGSAGDTYTTVRQ